ncbi:ggtb-1 [Pristionchus pacificus]|nr:ggtb-1 [Pristionchus pacificus]
MSFAGFLDLARKDVDVKESAPSTLLRDLHATFIKEFEGNKNGYEYIMSEYLRISGIYWCVAAMDLLGKLSDMDGESIVSYVLSMQRENGGFAPAENHDAHLLHTLCAIQILYILGAKDRLGDAERRKVIEFVKARQLEDGSFSGDESNEIDTRFSFVALCTLHLLDSMEAVDTEKACEFVLRCYNPDGGFGTRPGSESHSGQVYCCVGALKLTDRLDSIDRDKTAQWLAMRQCNSGGLNGRPEKLPDVCYSWWVLSSLAMLRRLNWIDQDKMIRFIYACQDDETGGFSDRPGDMPDPFHTVFGTAALSLFGRDGLEPVDAVLCMTKKSLGTKTIPL